LPDIEKLTARYSLLTGMTPERHIAVKEPDVGSVPQPFRFEGASNHLFTHTVEQGKGRGLAIGTQHLAEGCFERCFGNDLGLYPGGETFRPGLAVAFHGGQAFFFPDQRVDVVDTMFHKRMSTLSSSDPSTWIRPDLFISHAGTIKYL
jgi:hypothetical protein